MTIENLSIKRASNPDNVGGFDYAIVANDPRADKPIVVAECFEIVENDMGGGYIKLDARANALLFAASSRLLAALHPLVNAADHGISSGAVFEVAVKTARAAIALAEGRDSQA